MEAQNYTILPADTLATITSTLFALIAANIGVIIAVAALGLGLTFVVRHFNKSTKKLKG